MKLKGGNAGERRREDTGESERSVDVSGRLSGLGVLVVVGGVHSTQAQHFDFPNVHN